MDFNSGFNVGLTTAEQILTEKMLELPKETAMDIWDFILDVKLAIREKVIN